MLTVVETLLFQRQWPLYWPRKNEGRSPHISLSIPSPEMLCPNPAAFAKCVGGVQARGKSGGVRVIYFTRTAQGDRRPRRHEAKEIRRAIEE